MVSLFYKSETMEEFADKTTMHGFMELYNAKSKIWKIIWSFLIGIAIGLTCFQVYNLLQQLFSGKTSTTIQPLEDDVIYPPIKICYPAVTYVINWTRAVELGFDKSTLMYGMTFLIPALTTSSLDVNATKQKFFNIMALLNLTRSIDMYQAITYKSPPGFQNDPPTFHQPWKIVIDPADDRMPSRFCYEATNEMIQQTLSQSLNANKNSISMIFNKDMDQLNRDFINEEEEIAYSFGYFSLITNRSFSTNFTEVFKLYKAVPRLYVDNSNINFIIPSNSILQADVKLTGTLYKWLKSKNRQCVDGTMDNINICDKFCFWKEMRMKYENQCVGIDEAMLFNKDNIDMLCTNGFVFLSNGTSAGRTTLFNVPYQLYSKSYNSCIAEKCVIPCQQFKFDSSISIVPLPSELISLPIPIVFYIEYPTQSNILVIEEVQTQTWETFIGNIGGIVGLWLGASIISLFQMIYLCCFTRCDKEMSKTKTTVPI